MGYQTKDTPVISVVLSKPKRHKHDATKFPKPILHILLTWIMKHNNHIVERNMNVCWPLLCKNNKGFLNDNPTAFNTVWAITYRSFKTCQCILGKRCGGLKSQVTDASRRPVFKRDLPLYDPSNLQDKPTRMSPFILIAEYWRTTHQVTYQRWSLEWSATWYAQRTSEMTVRR